jgi:hypothetical protein
MVCPRGASVLFSGTTHRLAEGRARDCYVMMVWCGVVVVVQVQGDAGGAARGDAQGGPGQALSAQHWSVTATSDPLHIRWRLLACRGFSPVASGLPKVPNSHAPCTKGRGPPQSRLPALPSPSSCAGLSLRRPHTTPGVAAAAFDGNVTFRLDREWGDAGSTTNLESGSAYGWDRTLPALDVVTLFEREKLRDIDTVVLKVRGGRGLDAGNL